MITFHCDACHTGDGYSVMLRTVVWCRIRRDASFLCEACIRKRLGQPITGYMLRDCEMNANHPSYWSHSIGEPKKDRLGDVKISIVRTAHRLVIHYRKKLR